MSILRLERARSNIKLQYTVHLCSACWQVKPNRFHFIFMGTNRENGTAPKQHRKKARGEGKEAAKVIEALNGFDASNCFVKWMLDYYYSTGVTHSELRSIAMVLCCHTGLKLERLQQRDNRLLIKWFFDNWSIVGSFLPRIKLLDKDFHEITLERQLKTKEKKTQL